MPLTLEQRLRALLREYSFSRILIVLASIAKEWAYDAAQDGHFNAEVHLKHMAYVIGDETRAIVERDEETISNYLKDKRNK